jgi:prevent-host-death family protein
MGTVGAYEAKTHFPKLMERVRKGEKITITKYGVPIAVLQPPETVMKEAPQKVIDALRTFRRRHRLNGVSLKDMLTEGRR